VQQISVPTGAASSPGDAAVVLAVVVLSVLVTAVLILAYQWRQVHARSQVSLAEEAERWLRERGES
jgi:hypothetical protein